MEILFASIASKMEILLLPSETGKDVDFNFFLLFCFNITSLIFEHCVNSTIIVCSSVKEEMEQEKYHLQYQKVRIYLFIYLFILITQFVFSLLLSFYSLTLLLLLYIFQEVLIDMNFCEAAEKLVACSFEHVKVSSLVNIKSIKDVSNNWFTSGLKNIYFHIYKIQPSNIPVVEESILEPDKLALTSSGKLLTISSTSGCLYTYKVKSYILNSSCIWILCISLLLIDFFL